MSAIDFDVLYELGKQLQSLDYSFTAVTPSTHARVLERQQTAENLCDVFGWNRPFHPSLLSASILECAQRAGVLSRSGDLLRANVRFATIGSQLFAHSGFPTRAENAVFFGPDTYRFARFLQQYIQPAARAVDVGAGSGAGGLSILAQIDELWLTDINPSALEFAKVNARLADAAERVQLAQSDVLQHLSGEFDLIVANPPYLVDDSARTYRHGGSLLGAELSVRIVTESLQRLSPGGQLLLYTASAIERGRDVFWQAIEPLLRRADLQVKYFEIDPDVFGEELERSVYANVDRIAVVGLVVGRGA